MVYRLQMNILELAQDAGMLIDLDGKIGVPNTEASIEQSTPFSVLHMRCSRP